MDMGLKGKTAIICASSRGLGKGCAKMRKFYLTRLMK